MKNKIYFIKNSKTDEKLLPFQYYNLNNLITIPLTINDKKPFIKGWNLTKKNNTSNIYKSKYRNFNW